MTSSTSSQEAESSAIRVVFDRKQVPGQPSVPKVLRVRLRELYELLDCYEYNETEAGSIHFVAILGAVARLFEALDAEPFKSALTPRFRKSCRRIIYHSRQPFGITAEGKLIEDLTPVVSFFKHCFEHCNLLLGAPCPSLSINLADRDLPYFREIFNMSLNANARIQDSERLSLALSRLYQNELKLHYLLDYLIENPRCFLNIGNISAQDRFPVIIGAFIGTEVAWLSCDASSIRRGLAINDLPAVICSPTTVNRLIAQFIRYIDDGKNFRHRNMAFARFVEKYMR